MSADDLRPSERSPYAGVQHFFLHDEPVQLKRRQWNPHRGRDVAALRGVVLHTWDTPVGTTARNRSVHGEALALARRGLSAAYTISAGVAEHSGEPVVVLAHPPERYTYASDSACGEWLAVGIMGRFAYDDAEPATARDRTEESAAMVLAVGAALDLAVRILAGPEREAGPFALITHRQAVNGRGDHRECPGEAVVRMALQSEAVRRGALVPDPDLVLVPEWGLAWPDHWRRMLPTFAAPQVVPPQRDFMPARRAVLNLPAPPVVGDRHDPRDDMG